MSKAGSEASQIVAHADLGGTAAASWLGWSTASAIVATGIQHTPAVPGVRTMVSELHASMATMFEHLRPNHRPASYVPASLPTAPAMEAVVVDGVPAVDPQLGSIVGADPEPVPAPAEDANTASPAHSEVVGTSESRPAAICVAVVDVVFPPLHVRPPISKMWQPAALTEIVGILPEQAMTVNRPSPTTTTGTAAAARVSTDGASSWAIAQSATAAPALAVQMGVFVAMDHVPVRANPRPMLTSPTLEGTEAVQMAANAPVAAPEPAIGPFVVVAPIQPPEGTNPPPVTVVIAVQILQAVLVSSNAAVVTCPPVLCTTMETVFVVVAPIQCPP